MLDGSENTSGAESIGTSGEQSHHGTGRDCMGTRPRVVTGTLVRMSELLTVLSPAERELLFDTVASECVRRLLIGGHSTMVGSLTFREVVRLVLDSVESSGSGGIGVGE